MKKTLYKIVMEGFKLTDETFARNPIYEKGDKRIVYDPKRDRIVMEYKEEGTKFIVLK